MPSKQTPRELIDAWLTYAKTNKIRTASTGGKQAEDTDLAAFLKKQGFTPEMYEPLIDELPEAPASDEQGPDRSLNIPRGTKLTGPDKARYVWAGDKWLNDDTFVPASTDVAEYLNNKFSSAPAKSSQASEPEQEPSQASEPEQSDGTDDQEQAASSPSDGSNKMTDMEIEYFRRIARVITRMNKRQKQQLMRELL